MRLTWKPQAWRLLTGLPMLCIPASPPSLSPSGSLLLSAHLPHPLLSSWLPPLCFCPHIVLVCTRCRGCSRHRTTALLISLQSRSGLEGTGVKHSCPDGSRTRDGQFPMGTLERGQPHTIQQPLILTKQPAKFFLPAL